MIQKPLLFMLLLAGSMLISHQVSAELTPGARKVLKAHVDAMGGWKNWSQIESLRMTGTIERNGQQIEFCIIKKRPQQIRATLTIPIPGSDDEAMQMIRAHDGKHGWSAMRRAGEEALNKTTLSNDEAQALLNDASVLPKLIQLWRAGCPMQIIQHPTPNNGELTHIKATTKTADATYTFVLDQNHKVTAYTHTTQDQQTTQTQLSDYQQIDGLSLPMHTEIHSEQTGRSIMTTEAVTVGVGIYEDYFASEVDLQKLPSGHTASIQRSTPSQ